MSIHPTVWLITLPLSPSLAHTCREVARRERQRQLALAPEGQKALRNRVVTKRERAKEVAAGNRRHEEALRELNQRRAEGLARSKPLAGPGGRPPPKGASSGVRSKNRHMQEFNDIKNNHRKRKGTECMPMPVTMYVAHMEITYD